MPKLPLWKSVLASNRLLWSNRDQLVAVMWAWLLVMLPAYALAHWIDARAPWLSLDSLIELPFLASVAVGWHRLLLEGRRITAPYLNLDGAVLRYTFYSFVIWLMWLPLSLLPEANDDAPWPLLAAVLGVLAAILLFGRVSLIFPAIAVDRRMSLAQSWHLFLARLRRMIVGQHHWVSGHYLHQYAAHAAWMEDHRREDNGQLCHRALGLALTHPVSRTWKGYWQR